MNSFLYWIASAFLLFLTGFVSNGEETKGKSVPAGSNVPLVHAHAHNDYEHARPLFDALDHGFTSIEADVYLVSGELLVAHNVFQLSKQRTLEGLYLKPLMERSKQNGGRVYRDGPSLTLLVDIKRDGATAYAALHKLLTNYKDMVSETIDGRYIEKAVTVIVSGDRPIDEIASSNPRYAGIDGRLGDLECDLPTSLMPLISDQWSQHFQYRGIGDFSNDEKNKLREIVEKVHRKGRRIRFWATTESESLWRELRDADVDLIGSDELGKLSQFFLRPTKPE